MMHHIPQLPHQTGQSKGWDGEKANAKEQCPLLNFNLLEKQLQKTLQDRTPDAPQDVLHDNIKDKQEIDLTKGLRNLTLKEDADTQNVNRCTSTIGGCIREEGQG